MTNFFEYSSLIDSLTFYIFSPLYQAIMENPLVQLSLNNARVLGGK